MKSRAQIGYEAYATFTGGKTFDGREMPKWDELPERIKGAWSAAEKAISAQPRNDVSDHIPHDDCG